LFIYYALLLNWLNFVFCFFWLTLLAFLANSNNVLLILLYAELTWIILYVCSCYLGSLNDDLNLISLTFFFLALAGLEFCVGFLIIILLRNFKKIAEFDINGSLQNFTKKQITFSNLSKTKHLLSH